MKQFFWKFAICILPCILAAWVTSYATIKYYRGDSGGFKLGVDLVGGTILVYEIDLRKNQESGDNKFDPIRDISVLAESLKRRIDPNDLYNITIRPAGGEGRIEIILPTGGTHRTIKAEKNWTALVDKVEKRFVTPWLLVPDAIDKLKLAPEQLAKFSKLQTEFKEEYRTSQNKIRDEFRDKEDAGKELDNRLDSEGMKLRDDYLAKVEPLLTASQKTDFAEQKKEPRVNLKIGRGKTLELADQVQVRQSEELWQRKLFKNPAGWDRLKASARLYWARIDNELNAEKKKAADAQGKKGEGNAKDVGALTAKWNAIPVGDLEEFSNFVLASLPAESATTSRVIKTWFKQQAWEETMTLAREKWTYLDPHKAERDKLLKDVKDQPAPELAEQLKKLSEKTNPFEEDMKRINPDKIDQLATYILTKGSVIGQAALAVMNPLVGKNVKRVFDNDKDPDIDTIRRFIEDRYGPPAHEIVDQINVFMAEAGQGRDLSVEEVQRIKDLVSKVGSLEFRILANQHDDKAAIDRAMEMIPGSTEDLKKEIADAAKDGRPPPGPRDPGKKEPKIYEITTATGNEKSKVTYSWVELGPQERRSLNLDNAAKTDPQRGSTWHKAAAGRDKALPIKEVFGGAERDLLQGALFYSRECVDRNLPEEERRKKIIEYFVLTRDPEFETIKGVISEKIRTPKIDGSYLTNATAQPGDDFRPTVSFVFNTRGGELFGNVTRKNVAVGSGPEGTQKRRHLAIILDGMVMSAPTINSQITTRGQISGNFTQKEVDALVNVLRAGRLPATLKPQPVSENTIAATLGDDTIAQGVQAIGLSFLAVLLFMIVYYRFAGIVASIALMANLLLTVGFMIAVQATFTLSGLAGIVLTLGMAVDANVLIYERLREERERGASLLQAIRNGYDRALPTIIDTHLSSIFTAIVLYVVGNDNLKGFAISLTVGLIISLFTSLYMTRVLFDFWQERGWLTKLTMMRLFAKPDIDFMSIRYVMFTITLVVSILGLALFIGRKPFNIDFVGGTAYGGKLTKGKTVAELRGLIDEAHQANVLKDVQVEEINNRSYRLTYPKGDNDPRTVTFSNIPEGTTPAERIASVKKRASQLPDSSVELLYNSTIVEEIKQEISAGKSRNFTIRTTEKEPELVQACIDQLLRDGQEPLLKKVFARADQFKDTEEFRRKNSEIRIRFFKDKSEGAKPAYGSQSFVKTLLTRELRREFAKEDQKEDQAALPFLFELVGDEETDEDGKYRILKVSFGKPLDEAEFTKVQEAIKRTETEFQARPQPDRLENFDSALANETRYRAMWAVLASWGAILFYLWFRFGNWTFGLAAVLCLIHDLFFTLGAIAACYFIHGTVVGDFLRIEDFKLDLPSVAALLTLVGYSVNDTIVVFDRIREVRGKNPDLTIKMINDSINQTLSRTILASLTVWLVVFVLYLIGGPGVHLFAFVMVVGVIVGTYSSIYIASPLLLMFGEGVHEEPSGTLTGKAPQTVPVETGIKPA